MLFGICDQLRFFFLYLGDPTVFGNLKPSPEVIDAVVKSVQSGKYNGYTASTGKILNDHIW